MVVMAITGLPSALTRLFIPNDILSKISPPIIME